MSCPHRRSSTVDASAPPSFALDFAIAAPFFTAQPTRDAAVVFYGGSMLLAAARGYAGSEILAMRDWILRQDGQVGCVVSSPLDAVGGRPTGTS